MSVSSSASATASLVDAGPAPEGALVRVPAAADEVDDGDALGCDRVLRQQPEGAGDLLGRLAVDDLTVEQHRAGLRA